MKIDTVSNINPNTSQTRPTRGSRQAGCGAVSGDAKSFGAPTRIAVASGGDAVVELSAEAGGSMANATDMDDVHLEAIRQAIKAGTLEIDPAKIAKGMLAMARSALARGPDADRAD